VEAYAGNYRQKNDFLNAGIGGAVVGALAGIRCALAFQASSMISLQTHSFLVRSIPSALGLGLGLGATMALFEYSGGVMGDPLRSARTEQGRTSFFKKPKPVTVEGDA
jgi:hypothetical protein